MKIEKIDINLLNSSEYNPRKDLQPEDIEYKKIKRSIEEFGYVDPIIVNKDMTVIGGNQRLKVLKELDYKKVDCVLLDLDKTKEKALNIALNKIEGEWDLLKLKDLLQELDTGEIDMDITGFDYTDLEKLMTQFHVPNEKDDEIPDITKEPISKLGDLYKLGEHRLLCGDATKIEDVEKLMNGNKADMVFTDPPYNALKSWNKDEAKSECRLDPSKWFKSDNMEWIDYKDLLLNSFFNFSGHSAYICCDFRIYPLIVEALNKNNWNLKHCIVWIKNVWGLGKRYRFQHEFIVYACKKDAPFHGDRSQSDVWEIDKDWEHKHPTQKPVALAERAIKNSSLINNIILDLFGGSGSTLIGCEKLKRKCYMMEVDPHYIDVIIKRYENYTNKKVSLINGNTRA